MFLKQVRCGRGELSITAQDAALLARSCQAAAEQVDDPQVELAGAFFQSLALACEFQMVVTLGVAARVASAQTP